MTPAAVLADYSDEARSRRLHPAAAQRPSPSDLAAQRLLAPRSPSTPPAHPIGHPLRVSIATLDQALSNPPTGQALIGGTLLEIVPMLDGAPFSGSLGSSATLSFPYLDANGDGIVDGTNPPIAASSLSLYTLDTSIVRWVELLFDRGHGRPPRVRPDRPTSPVFAVFGAVPASGAHRRAGRAPTPILGRSARAAASTRRASRSPTCRPRATSGSSISRARRSRNCRSPPSTGASSSGLAPTPPASRPPAASTSPTSSPDGGAARTLVKIRDRAMRASLLLPLLLLAPRPAGAAPSAPRTPGTAAASVPAARRRRARGVRMGEAVRGRGGGRQRRLLELPRQA